jgi:Flp pilus assembly protein TadG
MIIKAGERGQALILITLVAIGLFAFAALAIDGSMAYSNKRHAQNAADTAALAGALAYARGNNIQAAVLARAQSNGYVSETDGAPTVVTVTVTDVPEEEYCPGDANGKDITVTIESYVNGTLSKVIGRDLIASGATATSRACGYKLVSMFHGDAIVGLDPDFTGGCAIDTGNSNSKSWVTRGGGVFSNGCLEHPNGTLTIPNDKCITTVGNANTSGGGTHNCVHENQGPAVAYSYPEEIAAMMPPDPCTGAVTAGRYAAGGKVPAAGQTVFTNDVFCISDFSTLNAHIELSNATLYVTDTSFSTRFNGGGNTGFFGTASTSGVYQGYYMIIKMLSKAAADRCDQYFDFRGNGNLQMVGTILAPSTCMDYRGNSTGYSTHSQMIFYRFTSNGNANIDVTYVADENHRIPISPSISLLE